MLRKAIIRRFCVSATITPPRSADVQDVTVDDIKKSKYLNFNITSDLQRMDLGLLIERPPIFLPYMKSEIDRMNKLSAFMFAHKLRDNYPKELLEFSDDVFGRSFDEGGVDENITHEMKDEQGNLVFYRENSKKYQNVDPNVTDPHSIQVFPFNTVYLLVKDGEGKWTVPYFTPESQMSAEVGYSRLKFSLFDSKFVIKDKELFPVAALHESIPKREIEQNKLLTKLNGRKVLLFTAYHTSGMPSIANSNWKDFNWVPKAKIGSYISKDNFDRISYLLEK